MQDLLPRQSEVDAAFAKASELYRRAQLAEAERLCQSILAIHDRHLNTIYLLGLIHLQQGRIDDGERQISRAIEIGPAVAAFHFNRGKALQGLERFEEAIASYDSAIALKPDFAAAFNNRANALSSLRRYEEAVVSYDRAIAFRPDRANVFNNRGNALVNLRRFKDACASYSRAIALEPDFLEAVLSRAWTLSQLGRHSEGLSDCEQALTISPGHSDATRLAISAQLSICGWRALERHKHSIDTAIEAGACVVHPGDHRSFSDSEEKHLLVAQNWLNREALPIQGPLWRGELYQHAKIRLAYLSSDFRSHATAHLMAGVFEQHDKSKFEVIALSSHPDDNSEVRRRIFSACDQFISIENLTNREVALLIRQTEIDIAVDLHGFADNNRLSVFSARPAPLQVNYLGYPGTLGAPFMDYIIADHVVIPVDNQIHYREKVVYVPNSYQPNDSRRPIPARTSSRSDVGLPESSFVFCCFNVARKITAPIFDVWMRLLCACPSSVLWLLADNIDVINNLRREAEACGVEPPRLVFAAPTSHTEHLSRYCLADLFLDTLPYNGHTTASDALWTGLPVLTCAGNTFSGRVAASLLHAIGLPELVTSSLGEYEELALALAHDPDRLSAIKTILTLNREKLPLFDTFRYTRNLEAAFFEMRRRLHNNEAPESFAIQEPWRRQQRLV